MVRRALAAYLCDQEAPPNYSVWIESAAERARTRKLNMLYRSSQLVVRSRSPRRVLEALIAYLAAHAAGDDLDPSLFRAAAIGAVREGEAVLLPHQSIYALKMLQPRLRRAGFQLVDAPFATVDSSTFELVVPRPALEVDAAALDELDDGRSEEPEAAPPGRYPLRGWAFVVDPELPPTNSRATAVAATLPTLDLEEWTTERALGLLAGVFETVRPFGVSLSKPAEVVARSAATLGG